MDDKDKKYVYLLGNEHCGFTAHTYNKKEKDLFLKYRKGFKSKKVKADKVREDLSCNTEIVSIADGIYLSAIEEEYFIESFGTFKDDSFRSVKEMISLFKFLKFSDDDREDLSLMQDFLKDYVEFYNNIYPDLDEDTLFDINKAAKYFLKNILDSDTMSYSDKG